jgi:hypothetical protein
MCLKRMKCEEVCIHACYSQVGNELSSDITENIVVQMLRRNFILKVLTEKHSLKFFSKSFCVSG